MIGAAEQASAMGMGVPAILKVAEAATESGWGTSQLGSQGKTPQFPDSWQ